MEIFINDKVLFVSGACNGAIYDFNQNKIYSVNHDANKFLMRIIQGGKAESIEEEDYLLRLERAKLLQSTTSFHEYLPNYKNPNRLYFAWLEVTQTCNLRCVHCYEGETHQSAHDILSVSEWKHIIKELAESDCPNIQFIGGEPSCFENVSELIDYAGTFNFQSIGFFTNATLITDDLMLCFIRNHVKVNVSVYGHNAEVHERITLVHGSFDRTVSNIKRFVEQGIQVTAAITIMRENEMHYESIVEFVKSLGVRYHKFDLVREVSGCNQNCHLATRDDLLAQKYRTKPNFSISYSWFEKAYGTNTCWFGKFAITENGKVIPCVFERNIIYGNLKEKSINQLLESETLNQYWHMDFSKIEECKDCEFRFACKDCRPLGKFNGGINKKSKRCKYHPATGKWE